VVREAPVGYVELRRRDPEVEEEAVYAGHLSFDQKLVEVAEVALEEPMAGAGHLAAEAFRCGGKSHIVLVDSDREASRSNALGQSDRVPRSSERAVADNLSRLGVQGLQHLGEHDGIMPIFDFQRELLLSG
jgi:hypothetical protein